MDHERRHMDKWDNKQCRLEVGLEIVKQNGNLLQYVENQTPEICLEAVIQSPLTVEYIKINIPELLIEQAIKKHEEETHGNDS